MRLVLALVAAVLLGVSAAALTRHAAEALQDAPDTGAIAAVVYPGAAVAVDDDPTPRFEPAWRGFLMARDTAPARHITPRDRPAGPAAPLVTATRDRLAAAGWRTADGVPSSRAYSANRGGTQVDFYAYDTDTGLDTFAVVRRVPGWWANRLAVAGGLLGALAGAALAHWATRRWRDRTPRTRTVLRETTVVGGALVLPAVVQTAVHLSGWSGPAGGVPYSPYLILEFARWPALLGVPLLAATVVALAVPYPRWSHRSGVR